MQELDYLSPLQLDGRSSLSKAQHKLADLASTVKFSKPKLESVVTIPRKKKRGSNRLIRRISSTVEAESNQGHLFLDLIKGILKADLKRLQPQMALSDSFENPSFFRWLVIGFTHVLSGYPHFISRISTTLGPFLTGFHSYQSCIYRCTVIWEHWHLMGTSSMVLCRLHSLGAFIIFNTGCYAAACFPLWRPGLSLLGVVSPAKTETEVDDEGTLDADSLDYNSLDISALIVPVLPSLIDPPPPLIASNVWAIVFN